MMHGILDSGKCTPQELMASDALEKALEARKEEMGILAAKDNKETAAFADVLFLAVKPQYFDVVFEEIKDVLTKDQVIISLAPGISIQDIGARLGGGVRVVRAMPNTPALLGEGMTGVAYEAGMYSDEEKEEISLIFSSCGRMELVEERLMDAVGCVSGSSPAFVYMFIEALADSGVKYGLPRKTAYAMAAQTVMGSARMVLETGKHPGQLKDEVCSPGGTTIAGVSALEEHGLRSAVIKAADACYEKTQRMK